uniref:Uncharacterized protein n=1 Tax=Leersia perrieri TaxID=77586 RepID=A0A0D9W515_9ORYZ
MQYHQGGSRMPPFPRGSGAAGGAYSRGYKQLYAQHQLPPPPPLPVAAAAPPQDKREVLMEAGRLAAEYLVAKGVLPPASLQHRGVGGGGGWAQLPPPPPPAQEAPVFHGGRNGRRRFDDDYDDGNTNPRSRRSRVGENNDIDSSSYNGRGKRKFGNYSRDSDWGRDKGRRLHSDSRSHDDDDDNGPPGYRRERRGGGRFDHAGSSMSGVAAASKTEATGESELEDTGSKVSSSSNFRKDVDARKEDGENEANKMCEDSNPSNSEVVEQGTNGESTSNNASAIVSEEAETKSEHLPVPSDDKVSDEKPDDSSVLNEKIEDDRTLVEKVEDDKTSDEKVPGVENNLRDSCSNLLNYCSIPNVPTRRRSILAHRNAAQAHREVAVAEQIDLVSSEDETHMATDVAGHGSTLTNAQEGNKDDLVCLAYTDASATCNKMVESVRLQTEETQIGTDDLRGHNDTEQHYAVDESKEYNKLSPKVNSQENSLKQPGEEGMQIYNVDTPPQDEGLIASADKDKVSEMALLPSIKAEADVTKEQEKLDQSNSFKICDLNLVGSPEVAELRNDPCSGQFTAAGCSMESQSQQHADFRTSMGNSASDTNRHTQIPLDSKVVQVIDLEDDSPIEAGTCDTSKAKSEMYASEENMTNPSVSTDVLPGIQDGYNLGISDYLGADIPCYQPMQSDLPNGMSLNDSESITVMDDSIYGSLSDIGFMEVWGQPPQDYEKFF